MRVRGIFLFSLLLFTTGRSQSIITTIAGTGVGGYNGDSIQAATARLYNPYSVIFDSIGNLFIADASNNRIRKIDVSGIVTTIAGTGTAGYNGDNITAISAQLYFPTSVAFDKAGNLFVADWGNQRVRKIDHSGIITTVAGNGTTGYSGDNGPAISAQLYEPLGLAFDTLNNLFISEEVNSTIRKVNTSGIITTIAGTGVSGFSGDTGPATLAQLNEPGHIFIDIYQNLFIGDEGNNRIRKINTTGIISTIAGTGTGGYSGDNSSATSAELNIPFAIVCDSFGNIFFTDEWNNVVRKIDNSGIITTIVGNGFGAGTGTGGSSGDNGPALLAELTTPEGITLDKFGNLYIADLGNHRIRKVTNVTVGVNEIKKKNLTLNVYPNPNTGSFSINILGVSNFQNSTVTIQNTLGETVKKISFSKNISVSDLAEGCYFIQVTLQNGETYKTKFIKQ
jgi:sugar lactone lactonase YvrE